MDFEKDLTTTESSLGVVTGPTIRTWLRQNPDVAERYKELLSTSIEFTGIYVPKGYAGKIGKGVNLAHPVKSQQIALIQALAKCKFEKRFSQNECVKLLLSEGIQISSPALATTFKRLMSKLGVKPEKGKTVTIASVADAEELVKKERKNLAKRLVKEKKSSEAVKEALKEEGLIEDKDKGPVESQEEDLGDSARFKDRKVIYTPTNKQIEFHQASETVVLYGGAAG